MDSAIRKRHVFGNDDLRAAAQVLVDSELPIDFSVFRHEVPGVCTATDIPHFMRLSIQCFRAYIGQTPTRKGSFDYQEGGHAHYHECDSWRI
jgi:hypothetical protein